MVPGKFAKNLVEKIYYEYFRDVSMFVIPPKNMFTKSIRDANLEGKGYASFAMLNLSFFPIGSASIYTIGDTGVALFHVKKDAKGKYDLELYYTSPRVMNGIGDPKRLGKSGE